MKQLVLHTDVLAAAENKQVLYKQLGVTVKFDYASTLQDGGVGFDTMLIGFSLDLSALPKQSCSTDRTYKCLGSQLWVFLSSEESKKAITVSSHNSRTKAF